MGAADLGGSGRQPGSGRRQPTWVGAAGNLGRGVRVGDLGRGVAPPAHNRVATG